MPPSTGRSTRRTSWMRSLRSGRSPGRSERAWGWRFANRGGGGGGRRLRRGEPTGEVALVVMVNKKVPDAELAPHELIPKELDGIPVDVLEVGDLRAGNLSGP